MMPASLDFAPASRRARSAGSDRRRHALGARAGRTARAIPGRPSMMAPCSNDSRIFMVWGRVSATTVAPRSAAVGRGRRAGARARRG